MEELSLRPEPHTHLGGTISRTGSSSEDWSETSTPPEKNDERTSMILYEKVPLSTYPIDTHQDASGPRFLPATELREFVIKIGQWENCTFRDLERIERFIIYSFFRSRQIMESSVTITWLIPVPFVKGLREAIETTSSESFMKKNIETITVGGKEYYSTLTRKVHGEKSTLSFLSKLKQKFGIRPQVPSKSTSMVPSEETQFDTRPGDTLQDASPLSFLPETELREFVMKLGHHWENCSFNDSETIKGFITSNFFPSEFVRQLRELMEGSITITWLIPPQFVRDLQRNVQHTSSELFMEQEIATIIIDGLLCYSYAEEYVRKKCGNEIYVEQIPSVEQYLSKAEVEADPSLPTKYKDYLSSTPAIRAALYTTFNAKMAAEVFTWSQHTESPPPTTMTKLFTAFTLKTLVDYLSTHPVYHKQQLKVTTFSDLPTDVYKQFQDLCRMAYEGILNRQQLVFSAPFDFPIEFVPLSLMQKVPQLYTERGASYYHFIHLTLQEFLAAVHISQLPSPDQAELAREHLDSGHFKMTIRFLAGLTMLANIPPEISTRLIKSDNTKLTYFHLLFEAKDNTLCSDVIYVTPHSWTPLDYYVTGHAISHSNCPWRLNFVHSSFSSEKLKLFCLGCAAPRGIGCKGHILYADFSSNQITSKSIQPLLNIPPHILHDMRELRLHDNKLDGSACDLLAKAVLPMSRLEEFWLGDNPIGSGGAVEVIKALCGSGVKELWLDNTGIGVQDCEALCKLLESTQTLQWFRINQNNLSSESVASIITGLSRNTTLTEIDISNSHVGMANVVSLASILRDKSKLTMLWLRNCHISSKGAVELAAALCKNTALKSLYLSHNPIGEHVEGVTATAEMLVENKTLIRLVLNDCHINGEGASTLGAALCKNSMLKHLDLNHNPIGVEGASSMSDMLQHNTSLEDLDLHDDSVREEGVHQLINSLKRNQTLKILHLPEKYKPVTSDHRIRWR